MPAPYSVALLGFSPFERNTLASYFRLATHRSPSYTLVQMLSEPDFMVADADHGPSVRLAMAEDMLARTVFIGAQAPTGATAWMRRPIDPLHVMRELDAMVALHAAGPAPQPQPQPQPQAAAPPVALVAAPQPRQAALLGDAFAGLYIGLPPAPSSGPDTGHDGKPHGDDAPTRGRPRPDAPALPESPEPSTPAMPPAHGQSPVALPRGLRRATIEVAFDGSGSSLPRVPPLAEPLDEPVADPVAGSPAQPLADTWQDEAETARQDDLTLRDLPAFAAAPAPEVGPDWAPNPTAGPAMAHTLALPTRLPPQATPTPVLPPTLPVA